MFKTSTKLHRWNVSCVLFSVENTSQISENKLCYDKILHAQSFHEKQSKHHETIVEIFRCFSCNVTFFINFSFQSYIRKARKAEKSWAKQENSKATFGKLMK